MALAIHRASRLERISEIAPRAINNAGQIVGASAARTGSLTFNAGETSKTVTVNVKGDRKFEWQEVFYLNLSGASGALLASSQGTGVVRNDDR